MVLTNIMNVASTEKRKIKGAKATQDFSLGIFNIHGKADVGVQREYFLLRSRQGSEKI